MLPFLLSTRRSACLLAFFCGFAFLIIPSGNSSAQDVFEYPYGPYNRRAMDPQLTGWPLSKEERSYVLLAEYERRPGREANQHLPQLWPLIPSAGFWGSTTWLDTHAKLASFVEANRGPCDVLLVGDSITQQWGSPLDKKSLNEAWIKQFASLRTINIGIGGDKIQNVLWRIDHGGVVGLEPSSIVLMIGNNNMFFAPETGVEAIAKGIQVCLANLRKKFGGTHVIVVKILPAHAPGNPFYDNIKKTNALLDSLKLDDDPKVHLLDLTADFLQPDGTLKRELFSADSIHLSLAGYAVYAERLKPLLDKYVGTKGLGQDVTFPR